VGDLDIIWKGTEKGNYIVK
jgi:hypothetical protein